MLSNAANMFGGGDADTECSPRAPAQCVMGTQFVTVIEKVNVLEALSAMAGQEIEMANNYKVVDADGEDMFLASEQTDCITRQIKQCAGDCAPWNVDMHYTQGGAHALAYKITRPFTCTCCCFNRPVATLTDELNDGATIASITDPYACCDLTFTIRNADEEPILYVKGGCCQMGLFCPLPCGPCAEVNFSVEDPDGNEVAILHKKVPGCCKFFLAPDVENYEIDFENLQTLEQRLSMIMLAIFIDFRYFNENSNDDNGGLFGGGDAEE